MRVPNRHLAAWAGPALPVAALGLPLVVYLPPYYAGTLGLPLATVGFLFALVRIIDIPIDPLLGALMDNSRSRFGQFRPWLVGGGAVLAAGAWLLFMAEPGVSAGMTLVALLVLYLGFSAVNLSQVSWGSRLSPDYAERARIFGVWTAVNVLATIAVIFIPPIVQWLNPAATPADGIKAMGWFIIAMIPIVVLTAALAVPEGSATGEGHRVRLSDVLHVLGDRRMAQLLVADLLISAISGMAGALFLFFFTAARGIPPQEASQLLLFYFVAGLLAAPFWVRLARRFGKHRATGAAALLLGLSQLLVFLMPAEPRGLLMLAMAVAGLPFAAGPFLLRAMLADLNDAQALDRRARGQDGTQTTGLNFAILTATAKLGYAIPVGLTYPILSAIGFDATSGAANSAAAIRGLEWMFVAPPLLLAVLAATAIWRWPITEAEHARIRGALDPPA